MKRCPGCKEVKDKSAFSVARGRRDGLQPYCKACNAAYHAANSEHMQRRKQQYAASHVEENRARANRYHKENRALVCAKKREAYAQNAEAINAKRRAEYAANKEQRRKEATAYRDRNRELIREYDRRRYQANPDRFKACARNRKARQKQAEGVITAAQWQHMKACYDYTCLCCGQQEPDIQLTPDHIVPLSRGGNNMIDNIQPLCLTCNLRKGTKTVDYRGLS